MSFIHYKITVIYLTSCVCDTNL